MIKKTILILSSLPICLVFLYGWSWILFELQKKIIEITGIIAVAKGDEWHPFFMILLILLPIVSTLLLLKVLFNNFK